MYIVQHDFTTGIYKHWKGGLYRATGIVYHHSTGEPYVTYHKCNELGIFVAVRESGEHGFIMPQPWCRSLIEWNQEVINEMQLVPRFTFIKEIIQ